jgi:hypothetical protein
MKNTLLMMALGLVMAGAPSRTCAENWELGRFGATNSPLIWSGYIFIDGHYMDAPYQVQQHGWGLFVNGTYLDEAIYRDIVYPPSNRPLVTIDPPMPTNLVATNTIDEFWANPDVKQKWRYLKDQNIRGTNLLAIVTNFFAAMPCITQVTSRFIGNDTWDINISGYNGSSELVQMPFPAWTLPPNPPTPPDSELRTDASNTWSLIQGNLKSGRSLWSNGHGVTLTGFPPSSNLVVALRITNATTKLAALRALGELNGVMGDIQNTEINLGHILTAFTASTQLEQRVSGDMTWTNNVPSSIPQPSP